jgi:hypothetical protein
VSEAAETDEQLLAELRRLRQAGTVALELDHRRLAHIDSPVAVEAEGTRWVYLGIVAAGAGWWFLGIWAGLGVAAAALALYLTLKADLRRRAARRIDERALADAGLWRRLWRFGGVTLEARDRRCAAPAGNWMQFVRDLRE